MEIVLASRNKKKIAELRTMLAEYCSDEIKVLSLDDIGYFDDIQEDGTSFEENSFIKSSAVARLGYIGVADDSGLCVDALDGEPGIYSARYSGEGANDEKNNALLLERLQDKDDRSAHFVCVVSCAFPEKMKSISIPDGRACPTESGDILGFSVRGESAGHILYEKAGEGGFGYDPLFFSDEKGKSFAQLTDVEKNEISHRGRAMRVFCQVLADIVKGTKC